jgi:hypothetical protein
MTPTLKFRDLNPLGRLMIVTVALLTFGIAAVAFITSYDALYDWVSDQRLYSDRVNQIWPLLLDAGFIVAQLAAILAGIMRAALHNDRDVHRGWPITAMLISGGLTVWFNILHADTGGATWSRRVAAALPPVLMMLAFEIDVQIVKWVMKALGKPIDAGTALSPIGGHAPWRPDPWGAAPARRRLRNHAAGSAAWLVAVQATAELGTFTKHASRTSDGGRQRRSRARGVDQALPGRDLPRRARRRPARPPGLARPQSRRP